MKKKLVFLSLILVLIFNLVGCSGSSSNPKTDETKPDSVVEEKIEKFKEKDASYLGTDEFGEDLNEMSDELYASSSDKGGYTDEEEKIWQYCMDRWDYYDRLEGGYAGDKYTENVFEDAANQFNTTPSKAEDIWKKVDRAKLGINY